MHAAGISLIDVSLVGDSALVGEWLQGNPVNSFVFDDTCGGLVEVRFHATGWQSVQTNRIVAICIEPIEADFLRAEAFVADLGRTLSDQPVILLLTRNTSAAFGQKLRWALSRVSSFVGEFTLDDKSKFFQSIADVFFAPAFRLVDKKSQALTSRGSLAIRRLFWLSDSNGDGVLSTTECSRMLGEPLCEIFSAWLSSRDATLENWLSFAASELLNGDSIMIRNVWSVLSDSGIERETCLPYTASDVASARCAADQSTYLSNIAIAFFASLYQPHRFPAVTDMWNLTPGCPWTSYRGIPSTDICLDNFIEAWKLMAIRHRDVVVKYARYWGFDGDASALFCRRRIRSQRGGDEPLPNTILVLVLGSPHCGKASLMRMIVAKDGEVDAEPASGETYVRTKSYFDDEASAPRTIVYMKLAESDVLPTLANPSELARFDVVLYAFDGSDSHSCNYWMEKYRLVHAASPSSLKNLAEIVLTTKADLPAAECVEKVVAQFCYRHRLLWPPVQTSVAEGFTEETDTLRLHEFVIGAASNPEICVAPEPVSKLRVARRVVLVAGALCALFVAVRYTLRVVRKKR